MFGFGKAKREATQVGEVAVRAVLAPFWRLSARTFDLRIWSDQYVLGLIQGLVGAQTLPITGRKLSTTDKGKVLLDVLRNLGATPAAVERLVNLTESKDAEFARGRDHALVTFLLGAGALKEERHSEPDVVAAKEAIPKFRELWVQLGRPEPRDADDELAFSYIYLKVQAHKNAHYPPTGLPEL